MTRDEVRREGTRATANLTTGGPLCYTRTVPIPSQRRRDSLPWPAQVAARLARSAVTFATSRKLGVPWLR